MVKLFCINLLRRGDRWERMVKLGDKEGLSLIRVDAVDAKDPAAMAEIMSLPSSGPTGLIGDGPRACTLSHAKAWKALLDSGDDHGVFLEDDVSFGKNFRAVLEELTSTPMEKFDLIKIEAGGGAMKDGALLGPCVSMQCGRSLRESFHLLTDAGGYILTRNGAAKMLKELPSINAGVDHALFYPVRRSGFPALRCAVLDPAIVIQDRSLQSDISLTRYMGSRWRRNFKRVFYELAMVPNMLRRLVFFKGRLTKVGFE